jgi:hypothetical protein
MRDKIKRICATTTTSWITITAILTFVAVWPLLFGLSMLWAGLTLAIIAIYAKLYHIGTSDYIHCRELSITLVLATLAVLMIIVPTWVIPHTKTAAGAEPPCLHHVFQLGTPCTLHSPIALDRDQYKYQSVTVDRFLIWELSAFMQTAFFGFLIYWGMKHSHFDQWTVIPVLLMMFAPLFALAGMILHEWEWQLWATVIFVFLILFEDSCLWFLQWRENSQSPKAHGISSQHETHYLARLTCGIDLPVFIGILILSKFARGPFADPNAQVIAERFFAGGTAFSLIAANLGIIFLRILMHWEEYQDKKQSGQYASLKHYLGFGLNSTPLTATVTASTHGATVLNIVCNAAISELKEKALTIKRKAEAPRDISFQDLTVVDENTITTHITPQLSDGEYVLVLHPKSGGKISASFSYSVSKAAASL